MVKEEKLRAVEQLKQKIERYSVVGMLDLHKLPSKQLQDIQKKMRGQAEFVVVKKSVMQHAIDGAKKDKIADLKGKIPQQPGLVFTDMDPFKFYVTVDKMKAPTFAKEGDVAEEEVFIPAGPTQLMAGPVISEFAKVKIPAGVEDGKIAVKKDTVAAKKGDVISKDMANIFRKLRIQPVKIGMNMTAVYDKGMIYMKEVLALAGDGYVKLLQQAHQFAINLSVAAGYPTKDNIKYLLARANMHAQALQSKVKTEKAETAEAAPATESPKTEEVKTETTQGGGAN
jgi:large subunit ribosomal protein L10